MAVGSGRYAAAVLAGTIALSPSAPNLARVAALGHGEPGTAGAVAAVALIGVLAAKFFAKSERALVSVVTHDLDGAASFAAKLAKNPEIEEGLAAQAARSSELEEGLVARQWGEAKLAMRETQVSRSLNSAMTSGDGYQAASKIQAQVVLKETTTSVFQSQPYLVTAERLPGLYKKYPALAKTNDVNRLFAENPKILRDAEIDLYRSDPKLFAPGLKSNELLRSNPRGFMSEIHDGVSSQTQDSVTAVLAAVRQDLEKRGISTSALNKMHKDVEQKLIDKIIAKEIDQLMKSTDAVWAYKNGKITVKGEIGHFSYEQEFSIISTGVVVGAGVFMIAGFSVKPETDVFSVLRPCIGDFCLKVDISARSIKLEGAEIFAKK